MKNKIVKLLSLFLIFGFYFLPNFCLAREVDLGGNTNPENLEGIGGWKLNDGTTLEETGAGTNLEGILSTVVGFLTIITGLWFVITFIVGGLGWASAGGDSGKVEKAQQKMTNGAIGLIIVVAAYSIIIIVGKVLGLDILNPAAELEKINILKN